MKKALSILCFIFHLIIVNSQVNPIQIAELTIKLNANESKELHYGFKSGDIVLLNLEVLKGKNLKELQFIEYPSNSLFMEYESKGIKSKEISILNTGVYRLDRNEWYMNIEEIRDYCLAKPGVTEGFPFDEVTLVFKVMNKMFALVGLERVPPFINLKCDPNRAIE